MDSLIITFDETQKRLYKFSVSKQERSKGQKRPWFEAGMPVAWIYVFQRYTPIEVLSTSKAQATFTIIKQIKKAVDWKPYLKPWVSKYA